MTAPFFSVIMPSFLGSYKGAATDRASKLIRAIDSVLEQTFKDFEIVVIADGCEETFDLVEKRYEKNNQVECSLIKKQPLWSGGPRQHGIRTAKGKWICYLDSDDKFGPNHLQIIHDNVGSFDWVWFDDFVMDRAAVPAVRTCLINQKYQNGTSNIAHKRECKVIWGNGYGQDDYSAVQSLVKFHGHNYGKIPTPEYYTCHVPVLKVDV